MSAERAPGPTGPELDIRDLANVIARQAEALAHGAVPVGRRYAHVRRLTDNLATLARWIGDDRLDVRGDGPLRAAQQPRI